VRVIPTPAAVRLLDIGALEAQTGRVIRSEHRFPWKLALDRVTALVAATDQPDVD
jgi:hypothetical protein